jgi:hypothetical protein
MSFTALNRRLLDYQISCGPVSVQIVSPWPGIGYATDADQIIEWFDELDSDAVGASAIYTGVSHGTPHHTDFRREGAVWTKNVDVPLRDAIFIDADVCDPDRPAGHCATDAEVATAVAVMDGVQARLLGHGVSEKNLVRVLSGNGANLLVLTSWPCDARSDAAIKGLLAGLAREHNTPGVSIDVGVHDRRRIRKLYGCMTRKKVAPGRPQRRSHVLTMPELADIVPCPLDVIERIVADLGSTPVKAVGDGIARPQAVKKFVRRFTAYAEGIGATITAVKATGTKTLILSSPCLLHDDHDGGVGVTADGIRCVQCFHNRCKSLGWGQWSKAVEQKYGPMRLDGGITWKR